MKIKLLKEFFEQDPFESNPIATVYRKNVIDHLIQIICDENGISEKAFKKWDQTRSYVEKYISNNPEVDDDINTHNDKRYQFTSEYLYDKYFRADGGKIEED